jgi:isopropylmalate/homocitrate/citramalate synthase
MLTRITGLQVQRNKAIVGANAFAHEAGIHQHGMLMHQRTYEIMRPEDVGVAKSRLVLGKHSGRHAFRARLDELGYFFDEAEIEALFTAFKRLADRKREVCEADLETLIAAFTRDGGAEPGVDEAGVDVLAEGRQLGGGRPWQAAQAPEGIRSEASPIRVIADQRPARRG